MSRQTVIGDVTNPPQVVVVGDQKKPILGTFAALALGAAIPGAGIAGMGLNHFLSSDTGQAIVEQADETVNLGLKRIGDISPDL